MGLFALCTGYLAEPFRDGEKPVSQSKVSHGNNDYSVMNCFAPGIEINPADGEFLVVNKLNDSSSFMVSVGGINQNIAPSCARGERKIYSVSSDGKTAKAIILLKNDGKIVFNEGTKSAAQFAELKTGFDKLKSDFNTYASTHVHPGVTAGSGSTGPAVSTPSTASIDSAESTTILIP